MKKLALTSLAAAAALGLAACGDSGNDDRNLAAEGNLATDTMTDGASGGANATATTNSWQGARIVEENGVTYRVNADGSRVALGANDSRIVTENDVRYRVDSDGTRVRIGRDGVQVDGPDIDLPDVDVGINEKGNLDVDVGDKDPDGGR